MARPFIKKISLKRSFFNKSSSVAGRTEFLPHLLQALNVGGHFKRHSVANEK
jgi:hypothetical protein